MKQFYSKLSEIIKENELDSKILEISRYRIEEKGKVIRLFSEKNTEYTLYIPNIKSYPLVLVDNTKNIKVVNFFIYQVNSIENIKNYILYNKRYGIKTDYELLLYNLKENNQEVKKITYYSDYYGDLKLFPIIFLEKYLENYNLGTNTQIEERFSEAKIIPFKGKWYLAREIKEIQKFLAVKEVPNIFKYPTKVCGWMFKENDKGLKILYKKAQKHFAFAICWREDENGILFHYIKTSFSKIEKGGMFLEPLEKKLKEEGIYLNLKI